MTLNTLSKYTDAETGFQYLRARYYDPATGNFLTRDPIEAVTRSAYGYVDGNPLNLTDPTGLCPQEGGAQDKVECPNFIYEPARFFSPGGYVRAGYYTFFKPDRRKAAENLGLVLLEDDTKNLAKAGSAAAKSAIKAPLKAFAKALSAVSAVSVVVDAFCSNPGFGDPDPQRIFFRPEEFAPA